MIMLRANFYNMLLRLQDKGGMQPYLREEANRILAAQLTFTFSQCALAEANALLAARPSVRKWNLTVHFANCPYNRSARFGI